MMTLFSLWRYLIGLIFIISIAIFILSFSLPEELPYWFSLIFAMSNKSVKLCSENPIFYRKIIFSVSRFCKFFLWKIMCSLNNPVLLFCLRLHFVCFQNYLWYGFNSYVIFISWISVSVYNIYNFYTIYILSFTHKFY